VREMVTRNAIYSGPSPTPRPMCFSTRCFLILGGLLIFPLSAFSQASTQCVEAASLWLPSEDAQIKVVSKWNKEVRFGILSNERDAGIVKSIEAELNFISQQSGLNLVKVDQFSNGSLPDLVIVIHPDIESGAERLRETALKFFQVRLGQHGNTTINAEGWAENLRNIVPKCGEIDSEVNGEKASSFAVVQENASLACIRVGLAETFGLTGARDYYTANNQKLPDAIVGSALRGLYSEKIHSGMGRTEVSTTLREACK
jgi:hypothetical protein